MSQDLGFIVTAGKLSCILKMLKFHLGIHSFFQCLKIILYEAPGWWSGFAACMNDPILLHISEFPPEDLIVFCNFDFGLNPVAYFEGWQRWWGVLDLSSVLTHLEALLHTLPSPWASLPLLWEQHALALVGPGSSRWATLGTELPSQAENLLMNPAHLRLLSSSDLQMLSEDECLWAPDFAPGVAWC